MVHSEQEGKKHACTDCSFCQWCGDDRCRLCRECRRVAVCKLSVAGQIALYEAVNSGRTIRQKCGGTPTPAGEDL